MPLFGRPDIGKLEQNRDVKGLIKALEHRDKSLGEEAMEALERMGEEAIEPLINELRKISPTRHGGEVTVKLNMTIAEILGKIGQPAIEPLIAAIREDHVGFLRINAVFALGKIGEPAVKPLIEMLSDPDGNVGACASLALTKIGDPAVEPLIKALADVNYKGRMCAALALGGTRDRRAIEPLRRALRDDDRWVRLHSAGALTKIDPYETQGIQLLKEAASDYSPDSSEDYRDVAALYLKDINPIDQK